jgi:branched-chain amino acid transport system permease protein
MELAVLTLCVGLAANALIFNPSAPLSVSAVGASLPPQLNPMGLQLTRATDRYFVALATAVVAFALVWWLLRSSVGLTWKAIRAGNAVAAASGIRIGRHALIGCAVASALAGLAGVELLAFQRQVTTDSFSTGPSLLLVVVAMVGGVDRLRSALIGGVVLGIGQQVLPTFGLRGDWLSVVFGLLVMATLVARREAP